MRAVFLDVSVGGGGSVKRECAGTGVFVPRRYGNNNNNNNNINNINNFNNNPHDSRKKLSCSIVLLQAKVVQALNLNFDDIHSHVQAQQRFNGGAGISPNYGDLSIGELVNEANHEAAESLVTVEATVVGADTLERRVNGRGSGEPRRGNVCS
ncbi:hypothetical protein LWI28_010753 [Acer negundo]|uniref:Uncharacterized protein n=1 Tax=Acer negundo TaxID=4023 RepID=A0AAD5NTL4_ACENE|nr:hypothetical protein LWI28_010753 [Acer negundo]